MKTQFRADPPAPRPHCRVGASRPEIDSVYMPGPGWRQVRMISLMEPLAATADGHARRTCDGLTVAIGA
jgi:hypothetical protein